MKGIVIYKGKYGATRQYAEWIGKELKLPVISADDMNEDTLTGYDFVILGSSVYVGRLLLSAWLRMHEKILSKKKVFLFIVCGSPAEGKEKQQAMIGKSVPPSIGGHAMTYFMRGRMIYKNLRWSDKLVLRTGAMLIKDPAKKQKMLTDFDGVKHQLILPLVSDVRAFLPEIKNVAPEYHSG